MSFGKRQKLAAEDRPAQPRAEAVRVLRQIYAAFAEPIDFQQGDLVQTSSIMKGLVMNEGHPDNNIGAGVVLVSVKDRRAYSRNNDDDPVPAICVAMVLDGGIFTGWYESWQFERYSGPLPDAH